jgi:hypothetical protein
MSLIQVGLLDKIGQLDPELLRKTDALAVSAADFRAILGSVFTFLSV